MKLLAAIALGALSISSLSGPPRSPRSGGDPTPEMKRQLRGLVIAQEGYWANHGTYTTDVLALGVFSAHRKAPATAADSVWLQVIQAGGRSWWGRAVYGRNAKSCVIFIGTTADFTAPPATDGAQLKAIAEAVPVCDTF